MRARLTAKWKNCGAPALRSDSVIPLQQRSRNDLGAFAALLLHLRKLLLERRAIGVERCARLLLHALDVFYRLISIGHRLPEVAQAMLQHVEIFFFVGDEPLRLIDLCHGGCGFARRRDLTEQSFAPVAKLAVLAQPVLQLTLPLFLRLDLLLGLRQGILGALAVSLQRRETWRQRTQAFFDAVHAEIVRLHFEERNNVRIHVALVIAVVSSV